MISLDLYGIPVPQIRPRFARRGDYVHTYDPQDSLKKQFQWQIKSQYRDEPLKMPLAMDIVFFMPIPKATSGIKKRQMLVGALHHDKRPDVDNLQKFILDCLNDIVIKDDSQIADIRARKVYSDKPGTSIRIRALTEQNFGVLNEDSQRSH